MSSRHDCVRSAHLYLVCDQQTSEFLEAVLRGGVDLVQLRCKHASDDEVLAAAGRFKRICHSHGAKLIINDRPDLAKAAGADGVHLGQGDMPVASARRIVGEDRLIGLSTHTPAQIDAAGDAEVDYIGVGPVYETPTKPGRAAVGLSLVEYASRHARVPWFAIGGISAANIAEVTNAGASRVAVVRALTEAIDPEATACELRAALASAPEARVGAA